MTAAWLAWRDMRVRPARALLAVAIVGGCVAILTYTELAEGSRDAAVSAELDRVGVPLRVVAARPEDRSMRDSDADLVHGAGGTGVRAVEPWLRFETTVGGRRMTLAGAPPASTKIVGLGGAEVALGSTAADRLGAVEGATIEVAGSSRRAHLLDPVGGPDDAVAFVPLATAQKLLGQPGAISEIGIRLWPTARVEEVRQRILHRVPGIAVLRMNRGEVADATMISSVRVHHLGVFIATMIAAVLCLVVAAWLDAAERRIELAGLVALGATRRDLFASVAARSALVAAAGAVGGALVGAGAAAYVGDWNTVLKLMPALGGTVMGSAVLLGIAAAAPTGLVTAWRDPVADLQESTT